MHIYRIPSHIKKRILADDDKKSTPCAHDLRITTTNPKLKSRKHKKFAWGSIAQYSFLLYAHTHTHTNKHVRFILAQITEHPLATTENNLMRCRAHGLPATSSSIRHRPGATLRCIARYFFIVS